MWGISGNPSVWDPTQGKSCLKRLAGSRSPKKSPNPRVYRGASDMKRRKRVKFAQRDGFRTISFQQGVSSLSSHGNIYASSCDDAKTSEYKSFKKLLEDAGRSSHYHKLVREGNISSGSVREATSNNQRNEKIYNDEMAASVPPVEKVIPIKQEPALLTTGALDDKELHYKNGGTFYEKRQNLIKYAASVLSVEVNEFISKGCDLVPIFLNRLGINRKADSCDELPETSLVDLNVKPELLAYLNMQTCLEQPYDTLETNHVTTVVRGFTEDNIPAGWWGKTQEFLPSTEHLEVPYFPSWNMAKTDFPRNRRCSYLLLDDPDPPAKIKSDLDFNPSAEVAISRCKRPMLDNKILTCNLINHKELSPFGGHYEEQSVLSESNLHFLEFDILHSPSEVQLCSRQRSRLPLLGWSEEANNEEELFVASDSMEVRGLHQLPLTLCRIPYSHGPAGDYGIIDNCTDSSIFYSFCSNNVVLPSLNHVLLPSKTESAMGLEFKDLSTDICRDLFLSYSPNRPFSSIPSNSELQTCLVGPSIKETGSQFCGVVCDLYDFSSFGFGISPEKKKMLFLQETDE